MLKTEFPNLTNPSLPNLELQYMAKCLDKIVNKVTKWVKMRVLGEEDLIKHSHLQHNPPSALLLIQRQRHGIGLVI